MGNFERHGSHLLRLPRNSLIAGCAQSGTRGHHRAQQVRWRRTAEMNRSSTNCRGAQHRFAHARKVQPFVVRYPGTRTVGPPPLGRTSAGTNAYREDVRCLAAKLRDKACAMSFRGSRHRYAACSHFSARQSKFREIRCASYAVPVPSSSPHNPHQLYRTLALSRSCTCAGSNTLRVARDKQLRSRGLDSSYELLRRRHFCGALVIGSHTGVDYEPKAGSPRLSSCRSRGNRKAVPRWEGRARVTGMRSIAITGCCLTYCAFGQAGRIKNETALLPLDCPVQATCLRKFNPSGHTLGEVGGISCFCRRCARLAVLAAVPDL